MLELSNQTAITSEKIIQKIDAYLSSFEKSSILSFSNTDFTDREEKHMLFLSKISNDFFELASLNAALASLIIKADKAADIESTLLMQKRFDIFCLFESALYNYTSSVEEAFANKQATASLIILSTQKLKLAAENVLKENSQI